MNKERHFKFKPIFMGTKILLALYLLFFALSGLLSVVLIFNQQHLVSYYILGRDPFLQALAVLYVILLNGSLAAISITLFFWDFEKEEYIMLLIFLASIYLILTGFFALSGIILLIVAIGKNKSIQSIQKFKNIGVSISLILISIVHIYLAWITGGFRQIFCHEILDALVFDFLYSIPATFLTIPEIRCTLVFSPTYHSFLAGVLTFFGMSVYFALVQAQLNYQIIKRDLKDIVLTVTLFVDGIGRFHFFWLFWQESVINFAMLFNLF